MGRRCTFSASVGRKICEEIARGCSLNSICKQPGMPDKSTVIGWTLSPKLTGFADQYAHAREIGYYGFEDDIRDVENEITQVETKYGTAVDAASVQAARLKADNLKWILSKRLPKHYGDTTILSADSDTELQITYTVGPRPNREEGS